MPARTTNIAWTDHTINFWWGCSKVSPACTHCYAEELASRFGQKIFGHPVKWGDSKPRGQRLDEAKQEAMALNRQAAKKGIRYKVFVNSMSDWLDDQIPFSWLAVLLETIALCPHLDFQLLTKRPENFLTRVSRAVRQPSTGLWCDYEQPPSNVWIGTTVENQEFADKRIPALLQIPAHIRFLSMEPLLGPVFIRPQAFSAFQFPGDPATSLHWVIAGGESGREARPSHPDWFLSIRDQCQAAGIPFFFKQWGEYAPLFTCGIDGSKPFPHEHKFTDGTTVVRFGTKKTGNQLDMRIHETFPTSA